MGLSTVKHFYQKGWKIAILDLNEKSGNEIVGNLGENAIFFKVDVSDYEQLADAFAKTWGKWHRLDMVYANAVCSISRFLALLTIQGIGDRINFVESVESRSNGTPSRPDTAVMEICLTGVVYCAYLALHFFRQNPGKNGKFVSTSSMAGLYPAAGIPLYGAAKHGVSWTIHSRTLLISQVVGFTRSLAKQLAKQGEPITINCVCPGLVDTGLTHSSLIQVAPEERITPHSTIVKAIESFLEDDSKNGCAAECSGSNIHYRTQPEWGDSGSEWVMTSPFDKWLREKAAVSG